MSNTPDTTPDSTTETDSVEETDAAEETHAEETDVIAETELPAKLRKNLYPVVEELVAHDGLLVALDFDGTLAAIERRPEDAAIPESTREAVAALADHSDVEVAVVSGRELDDVRERVGIDDENVSFAGNHGLEIHADEYEVHPEAADAAAHIAALGDRIADRLDHVDGVIVEDKGVTATVHHRLVADDEVPEVERAVESAVADSDDVRLTTGKDVLELRPAVEWDKGEAVRELYDQLVPDDERWLPMYVGDDTTDEAAFSILGDRGIGVKVGDDPGTEAPYRVADPEAVRAILRWLGEHGVEFLREERRTVPVGTA